MTRKEKLIDLLCFKGKIEYNNIQLELINEKDLKSDFNIIVSIIK